MARERGSGGIWIRKRVKELVNVHLCFTFGQ